MEVKKIIALSIITGILGLNIAPATTFAIQQEDNNNTKQEKKLTRKEKKALSEKQSKLAYINIDWWESYKDEYLQGYILKAIEKNQDLKIATLKVEEARQMAKLQLANELPTLSVGASPALLKMPGATNTIGMFAIPAIASYEADIFLKNHDKTKSAKKIYEASQFQEKATYLTIASQVGSVYYNIVKLDKLIAIQEEVIQDRKEIYELMKLSNEQGIISTSDLVKADKSYVMSTLDMIEYKKARDIMLNALCVLTGESPANASEIKRVSYEQVPALKAIPNEISSEVITARPDYMVAQKMIEKAGIDVRVAKKEFLPTIDILGLLGFTASSAGGGMNWANSLAAVGGLASLPIFTGGARIANFKINKNKYQQAILSYEKTNLTAIQEVNDTLSILKLDNEKYLKNQQRLQMEQKDFSYTQMKYDEGIISKLDLLQKKETLLGMQQLVTNSKTECLINQISLYKAVAGNL